MADLDPAVDESAQAPAPERRTGDPLEGLWHWSDHPAARLGIIVAILGAILVLFPILAQWAF